MAKTTSSKLQAYGPQYLKQSKRDKFRPVTRCKRIYNGSGKQYGR
jgi:hypothetical protein